MAQFESIVATALLDGIEISISEMIASLGIEDLGRLQGAAEVLKRITPFELILDPDVSIGDLGTPRVMKSARTPDKSQLEDRVLELGGRGESNTVEFKSSLIADMKRYASTGDLRPLENLEGECLKSVCAFMNSAGGTLLMGVDDTGRPCDGITHDLTLKNWSQDQWLLHWNNLIRSRFEDGMNVLPFVRSEMITLNSTPVCVVNALGRQAPTYLRRQKNAPLEFFVRLGPQSESLSLPAFYEYIRESPGRRRRPD